MQRKTHILHDTQKNITFQFEIKDNVAQDVDIRKEKMPV